jgi:hypothetical protein
MGCATYPFIDQGKDLGYMRDRGKEEREKIEKKRAQKLHRPSSPAGGSRWWCR